ENSCKAPFLLLRETDRRLLRALTQAAHGWAFHSPTKWPQGFFHAPQALISLRLIELFYTSISASSTSHFYSVFSTYRRQDTLAKGRSCQGQTDLCNVQVLVSERDPLLERHLYLPSREGQCTLKTNDQFP